VDTITDDYNTATVNQAKTNNHHQQQNGLTNRLPRSASVDRNSSSSYVLPSSRYNDHTNSYSRFMTYKYNNGNETINNSSPVIEIPTTIENGLSTSKSVGDLSIKNGLHSVEINGITNGSSPPNNRPPTILQTRRS
jgi:hypothetical protein